MRIEQRIFTTLLLALSLSGLAACDSGMDHHKADAGHHGHSADVSEEPSKGPHGGRLLEDDGFALELTVFERGVPPEFRLYTWQDGEPLAPEQVNAELRLTRLDGEVNQFRFKPAGSGDDRYLRGDGVVIEPHSFDVRVAASHAVKSHVWEYASHEGRVTISDAVARESGITTRAAGAGEIHEAVRLYGHIEAVPSKQRQIRARFPGLVRKLHKDVGDRVTAGEALVTVEADDSLRSYTISAPMDGVVVAVMSGAGEVAGDAALLTLADYSTLWAQLAVFPAQAAHIRAGQSVKLLADSGVTGGQIDWIAPAGQDGPAREARVVIDNASGLWSPGMAVQAEVVVDTVQAPLVVASRALQQFRDFTVVFAKVGETYEVRMLDLGRSDGEHTEVLGGLKPGTDYVVDNSYLIKADIEKSGAAHDH